MATKATQKSRKIHLERPTNERRQMCGQSSGVESTDEPRKATCLACKKLYTKNKKWFSSEKRKRTLAAKA